MVLVLSRRGCRLLGWRDVPGAGQLASVGAKLAAVDVVRCGGWGLGGWKLVPLQVVSAKAAVTTPTVAMDSAVATPAIATAIRVTG